MCFVQQTADDSIEQLLDQRLSHNTKRAIDNSVTIFSTYAEASNTSLSDLHHLPQNQVNEFLQRFYTEIRKKDGSLYTMSGLTSLRYGLRKHFLKTCGYDIVNGPAFRSSGKVFSAVLIEMKKRGEGFFQHKSQLSSADFNKLYSSSVLSTSNPVGLQNKVFVDVMTHLYNRGRNKLRAMKKANFHIRTDSTGRCYVSLSDRFAKRERRMYQLPGNPRCPVVSFEKYMAKLNAGLDDFWQKPLNRLVTEDDACWYENASFGKNMLGEKMKTLSIAAGLSTVYTNQCLRSTCVTASDSVSDRMLESD